MGTHSYGPGPTGAPPPDEEPRWRAKTIRALRKRDPAAAEKFHRRNLAELSPAQRDLYLKALDDPGL